ncbi:uncharacterized protein NESG_01873 [Nematocida ausubeli]|uniref:ESF1 RRM domain-containing protein n=1 Tax=Nematocida ausubeli (strain ATCC PRA-371 / ERTm2) TaxID=1913371 RepID=H8ZEV2_NEMA1|nr:uncharacterized protein NESG_01873 [Nematocida ausubeli]EHY64718.1 hypothetical protein NERG_02121 [Nematocida ausubeli]KFG25885.1 hypothetical protein NESG_01873 [Nematocida ausubeli]
MKYSTESGRSGQKKKFNSEKPSTDDKKRRKENTDGIKEIQETAIPIKPEDLLPQRDVPLGDTSSRVAILNVDWESIGVHEIYRVINAFVPKGQIKKVSLYKTKLGSREMAVEGHDELAIMNLKINDETQEMEIREYIKKKMKYFYAVVEVENEEIGKELYTSIDGQEIENTHNYIDARFIPSGFVIDDELVEEITQSTEKIARIPMNPLYSTKPQLRWDEDPVRDRYLKDLFVNEIDLDVADNLIDASDDEEKQKYYKKAMQMEIPQQKSEDEDQLESIKEPVEKSKTHNKSVDDEDIAMESSGDEEMEESSEAVLVGDDKRFAKENNPDFNIDKTHPAYISKQKKRKEHK